MNLENMYGEIIKSYLKRGNLIISLLIIFVLISPVLCQTKKPESSTENKSTKQLEYLKWENLSAQITKDLLNDIKGNSEQPIILGHLANLWWKIDNKSANEWIKKAVSDVTFEPITETETERQKRFEIAGKLTEFIIPLDKQLAKKLIEDIADQSKKVSNNQTNADSLVKTALQIVKFNPETAKELGSRSLKIGQSYLISRLIGELNIENSALAEMLFKEAVVNSKLNSDLETNIGFLSSLTTMSFKYNYKGKSLSEESKKQVLIGLFDVINIDSSTPESLQNSCNYMGIALGIIANYETYYPEKAIFIRQKAEDCKNLLGRSSSYVKDDLESEKPQTVEEYLRFAEDSKDKMLKKRYYGRAIEKLYGSKEYEKLISILDEMSDENRAIYGEFSWSSWRSLAASSAAVEFAKEKDFANVYRIINKTPKQIRSGVQISAAKELKSVDKSFAVTLLEDARKNLNSIEIEDNARAGSSIAILRIYTEIAPYEAINLFRETVKAVNKSDESNPDDEPIKDYVIFKTVVSLPVSLLEMDEINAMDILSKIDTRKSRIRFRLGFLEQSLKELEKSKSIEQKEAKSIESKNR